MTVVAIIGSGSETDRAIAVACAEAGADIALGTCDRAQAQEYAMNSIANEVWSIGNRHFVTLMDATEPEDAKAFAAQTWAELGRCDVLVANHDLPATTPLDELSADGWEATIRANLTGPFLAAHAFGQRMAGEGAGRVLFVAHHHPREDAAYAAARSALPGLAAAMREAWGPRGVAIDVIDAGDTPATAAAVLERLRGA